MLGKKPSIIDFNALLEPKRNLEKLAHATIRKDEISDASVEEKTAMGARLMISPKAKAAAVKASGIGRKKKKIDVSHLTGNKRADTSKSAVTRAGEAFGLPSFFTKTR